MSGRYTKHLGNPEYAKRNSFFNCQFYVDDGYSGTNYDRPTFQQLIGDIQNGEISTFITKDLFLRSKKEILDMADLVYRMDWAAVDARIHRMTGPESMDHRVVQARHNTLNWLIGFDNEEWNEVSTPT